jgi:hypothetical protein
MFETGSSSHMPNAAGKLCAVDLYGSLPIGQGASVIFWFAWMCLQYLSSSILKIQVLVDA